MDGHETDLVLFSLLKNLEQSHCPRKLAQPERLWASLPELDASPMYSTHKYARTFRTHAPGAQPGGDGAGDFKLAALDALEEGLVMV